MNFCFLHALFVCGLVGLWPTYFFAQTSGKKLDYSKRYIPAGRDSTDPVYVFVEEMPTFAGGKLSLQNFLNSAPIPTCVSRDSIANIVIFKFIVETDGTFSDLRVVRSPDTCFTNAATLHMKQMPAWKPGKRNGKEVACLYTLPLMYRNQ
jgi:protein TonB